MAEPMAVVRGLHLLFAALWGGGSLYHGLITMGFLNQNTEARRKWWVQGRFGPYLGLTSLLTLVFGIWAFTLQGSDAYADGEIRVLMVGMTAGAIGVVVGWGGHLPTSIKMAKAVQAGDMATVEALEHREHILDKISLVVVLVAVLTMTTFRMFA